MAINKRVLESSPTATPADAPTSQQKAKTAPTSTSQAPAPETASPHGVVLQKARRLLESGHAKEAFDLLNAKSSQDPVLRNARGVCLLRMQQPGLATRAFREIVLTSGGIGLRWDVPLHHKTNLALALLMDGNVGGCMSVLNETGCQDDPKVQRLLTSIGQWKQSLTLWQRIMWQLGSEPKKPVVIDFVPGDFE